jgi:hypothetical protein
MGPTSACAMVWSGGVVVLLGVVFRDAEVGRSLLLVGCYPMLLMWLAQF